MSKAERKLSPVPKPAAPKRGEHPLPEIFWREDDNFVAAPLPEAIELIAVTRVTRTGEERIDTCQGSALTQVSQLTESYGPGMYKLVARGAGGQILARITHTVNTAAGAPPAATPPHAGVPAGTQNGPSWEFMFEALNKANATVLEAVSKLAGARITDGQELTQLLLKMKPGAGGGGSGSELAAYKAGMKEIVAMMKEAGLDEEGEADEDKETSRIKLFVEGLREFNKMKRNGAAPNDGSTNEH